MSTPSLVLDYARTKALLGIETFSRNSPATYVGPDGKYRWVPSNAPRFTHDPYTGASLGLLIEEPRTNYALHSTDFTKAAWTKTGCIVLGEVGASPLYGARAGLMVEDTSNGQHGVDQPLSGITDNDIITASVFFKPAGRTRCQLAVLRKDGSYATADFECVGAGTVLSSANALSTAITRRADGYYRLEITVSVLSGAAPVTSYVRLTSASGLSYTGDGVSGGYVWGAQVEVGAEASSPIITAGSAVTRSEDLCAITGSNFSSWYNASEGTFFVDAKTTRRYGYGYEKWPCMLAVSVGWFDDDIRLLYRVLSSYTDVEVTIDAGGVKQMQIMSGQHETTTKWAVAYKTNDCALAGRGALIGADTSVTLPTVNMIAIGTPQAGGLHHLNGPIKQIIYWPVRLTNNYAQALTQ